MEPAEPFLTPRLQSGCGRKTKPHDEGDDDERQDKYSVVEEQ